MNQEESEQNEVDGMKKGADSTGEVMHTSASVSSDVTNPPTRLVLALVSSGLDYCNSLLSGLPNCTLDVLQRIENLYLSARLIYQVKSCDHISSSLQDSVAHIA